MMGLSYMDLYDMTPRSFQNKMTGHKSHIENMTQNTWEQTRLIIHACLSPHSKSKLKPRELLPFPWDNAIKKKPVIASKEHLQKIVAIREEQLKKMKFKAI